jgi:hypothetical protein
MAFFVSASLLDRAFEGADVKESPHRPQKSTGINSRFGEGSLYA